MEDYIKNILPSTSPLVIPSSAKITIQDKDSYIQVKYQWTRIEYKYLSRWHTRTPNAPIDEGDSWCVERQLPGIGAGPNARPAKREVLVGENEWVPKERWDAAIRDKKNGKLIEEKKKMLTIDIGMFKNNYIYGKGTLKIFLVSLCLMKMDGMVLLEIIRRGWVFFLKMGKILSSILKNTLLT